MSSVSVNLYASINSSDSPLTINYKSTSRVASYCRNAFLLISNLPEVSSFILKTENVIQKSQWIKNWSFNIKERLKLQNPSRLEKQTYSTEVFKLVKTLPGLHGGKRLVFKTPGPWFDFRKNYEVNGADFSVDPRVFITLLGVEGAWYFGFRALDLFSFVLPDQDELNGSIESYNQSLPENDPRIIKLKFVTSNTSFYGYKENVIRFLTHQELPCGAESRQFFHDMTVHALSDFFIPNEFILSLMDTIQNWHQFTIQLPKEFQTEEVMMSINKVWSKLSDDIDNLAMSRRPLVAAEAAHEIDFTLFQLGKYLWQSKGSQIMGPTSDVDEAGKVTFGRGAFESSIRSTRFIFLEGSPAYTISSILISNKRLQSYWNSYVSKVGFSAKYDFSEFWNDLSILQSEMTQVKNHAERLKILEKHAYSKNYVNRFQHLQQLVRLAL